MASRSLNRVILIGNLTRDPELKYTPNGTAVCTFGVATNRSWTTNDGQTKEDTQFHRIVAWQKLAELCSKLLTKGRKVYLEGRIVYRTFSGKDGQERSITEIVMDDFIVFGDGGKRIEGSMEAPSTKEEPVMEVSSPEEQTEEPAPKEEKPKKSEKTEDVNPDDIPF